MGQEQRGPQIKTRRDLGLGGVLTEMRSCSQEASLTLWKRCPTSGTQKLGAEQMDGAV